MSVKTFGAAVPFNSINVHCPRSSSLSPIVVSDRLLSVPPRRRWEYSGRGRASTSDEQLRYLLAGRPHRVLSDVLAYEPTASDGASPSGSQLIGALRSSDRTMRSGWTSQPGACSRERVEFDRLTQPNNLGHRWACPIGASGLPLGQNQAGTTPKTSPNRH